MCECECVCERERGLSVPVRVSSQVLSCTHTPSHPHQVTEEQIKLDLTDPSIMPTTDHYNMLVTVATDPYEAVTRAQAMVVCTEWDEFTTLDNHRI